MSNHPKYRMISIEVEAFQFTKERMVSNEDWPQWIYTAWNEPNWSTGGFWSMLDRYNGRVYFLGTMDCESEGGWYQRVVEDDWVVKNDRGRLFVFSPIEFEEQFEEVPSMVDSFLEK